MDDMTEAPLPEEAHELSHEVDDQSSIPSKEPYPIRMKMFEDARRTFQPSAEPMSPSVESRVLSPTKRNDILEPSTGEGVEEAPVDLQPAPQEPPIAHVSPPKKPNWLLRAALGALGIVGASGVGGYIVEQQMNGGGDNNSHARAIEVAKDEGTPFSTSQTESPSPTASATLTPEKTPDSSVASMGRYQTIEELPLSDAQKEAIREFTKDCDPSQMIIENNGLICLQKAIENRPRTINLDGSEVAVNQFHTLGLNKTDFPNADEMLETFFEQEKYYAWVNQSGSTDVTFEQWQAEKNGGHPYEVWAWKGTSDEKVYTNLNDKTFIIHKFVADGSRTDMVKNTAQQYSTEVIGNVVNLNIFATDPTYFGITNELGVDQSQIGVILTLDQASNSLGIKPEHNYLAGQNYNIFSQSQVHGFITSSRTMAKTIMPSYDFGNPNGWKPGIFSVTGTKLQP